MNAREREIRILGVPMDLGAGRRGVDMGPSAMRHAGIRRRLDEMPGWRVVSDRDVAVPIPEVRDPGPGPRYLREVTRVCKRLCEAVRTAAEEGGIPVVLGGDHSIAVGTVSGLASHYRERGQQIGLLWFDAHADMNTPETSPSQNIHGMPLASVIGYGSPELVQMGGFAPKVDPKKAVLIGIRNLDEQERRLVAESGIRAITMREIDERGMKACVEEALAIVTNGTAGFHLSFDMDGVDPAEAPGVGTPVRGGASFREAHLLMEMAADTGAILGVEITELNPILDDRNRTGELAVDLVLSAFGKNIL
ncbi:MAG: arginase [Planctomycetes bacterium]|nr:arginase [Planctomycetota bacterium]